MDTLDIKRIIREQLPDILREDEELREFVLQVAQNKFADKVETESRFDRLLAELKADREKNQQEIRLLREAQDRKWEAQDRKWEAQDRKWEANQQEMRLLREENQREMHLLREENQREMHLLREENQREMRLLREEQNYRWEENQAVINELLQDIKYLNRKYDSSIGALGARWGTQSERAFRDALQGILTDSFLVKVENITLFDKDGEVFGRPDQIELDVIIKNGLLIVCEIKSSISKSDMYTFFKKVVFYEKNQGQQVTRKIAISPMVDKYAQQVANTYGIEVYGYAEDVQDL